MKNTNTNNSFINIDSTGSTTDICYNILFNDYSFTTSCDISSNFIIVYNDIFCNNNILKNNDYSFIDKNNLNNTTKNLVKILQNNNQLKNFKLSSKFKPYINECDKIRISCSK